LSYYLWGIPDKPIDVVIAVGIPPDELGRFFQEVGETRVFHLENVNPWDRELPVTVCRKPLMPPQKLWQRVDGWEM
jgi:hypothetical protein